MHYLKQSTAVTVVAGPFVSTTDGYTAKTALSLTQAKCFVWKEGGTTFGAKNESTTGTHRTNGCYTIPFDTTDTNTLGILTLSIDDSANAALPVRHDFCVLAAQQYNSLIAASDKLQVDAVELNSVAAAAATQASVATACVTGAVYNDGGTYIPTNSGALVFYSDTVTEATADHYNGRVVIFTSGAMLGQALAITDYAKVASYGQFTCSVATELPANAVTFVVV